MEALIGFLILSIGMLGIASLQALSLKAGKTSVYNSVALMKVEQLFENMRANPTELVPANGTPSAYTAGPAASDCTAVPCSSAVLAGNDIFLLNQSLSAGLPAAATVNVVIVPEANPSKVVTVTVTVNWTERSKANAAALDNKNYTIATTMCSVAQDSAC